MNDGDDKGDDSIPASTQLDLDEELLLGQAGEEDASTHEAMKEKPKTPLRRSPRSRKGGDVDAEVIDVEADSDRPEAAKAAPLRRSPRTKKSEGLSQDGHEEVEVVDAEAPVKRTSPRRKSAQSVDGEAAASREVDAPAPAASDKKAAPSRRSPRTRRGAEARADRSEDEIEEFDDGLASSGSESNVRPMVGRKLRKGGKAPTKGKVAAGKQRGKKRTGDDDADRCTPPLPTPPSPLWTELLTR